MLTAKKTLVENYSHVYSRDPAIDQDDPELSDKLRLYRETGDESHLPLGDRKPTRWLMRQLRGLARAHIRELIASHATDGRIPLHVMIEACRLALHGAENLKNDDGEAVKIDVTRDDDLRQPAASTRSLDMVYEIDVGIIPELGMRAITEAILGPLLSRGSD